MRTEIDLDAAAAAGLIGEDQAIALRNFQATRDGLSGATSEKFQLFGGYADLVIGIGMAMIVLAGGTVLSGIDQLDEMPGIMVGMLLSYAAAAGLFAVTARINLRASPAMAMVLTAGFAAFSASALVLTLVGLAEALGLMPHQAKVPVFGGALLAHAAVMWVHWRRFRFPPTPALIVALHGFVALGVTNDLFPYDARAVATSASALLIATGAMIAGVWWDLTDIRRETERSQTAFWLHCVAGVLMSRALFSLLTGSTIIDGEIILTGLTLAQFPYVVAMVLGAAVISLLLDRRSLLVGCLLPTVGIFEGMGDDRAGVVAGLLLAGTALIFFSTAWVQLRTGLLALLPEGIAAQLPRTSLTAPGQRPTRRHKPLWALR
ncbi:MAG: hypothetical protein EAY70_01820 [Sphingomonadales bacterium]|nr:MAG: hypothetical protein EAY70_01820 [Sphingomonadales bacterium]